MLFGPEYGTPSLPPEIYIERGWAAVAPHVSVLIGATAVPRETIWEIWEVRGILTTRVPASKEEAFERVAGLLEIMARDSSNLRGRLVELMERINVPAEPLCLR